MNTQTVKLLLLGTTLNVTLYSDNQNQDTLRSPNYTFPDLLYGHSLGPPPRPPPTLLTVWVTSRLRSTSSHPSSPLPHFHRVRRDFKILSNCSDNPLGTRFQGTQGPCPDKIIWTTRVRNRPSSLDTEVKFTTLSKVFHRRPRHPVNTKDVSFWLST